MVPEPLEVQGDEGTTIGAESSNFSGCNLEDGNGIEKADIPEEWCVLPR